MAGLLAAAEPGAHRPELVGEKVAVSFFFFFLSLPKLRAQEFSFVTTHLRLWCREGDVDLRCLGRGLGGRHCRETWWNGSQEHLFLGSQTEMVIYPESS